MGPLVPEIFNQEFNYVIALVIGFFFGFILEQAGFSNSRRLTGLFYGYDFVVLRVFFTAGVTAMLGILFMGNMGWLDLSAIYIHPTFFYSAIIGGIIMGLGFILGGYCPGTSIAGAAIGKIDAMVFVVGAAIGIFFFGSIYDSIYGIYTATSWGNFTMYDAMGISPGLFGFMLTTVALLAFIFTKKIEDKVNKVPADNSKSFFAKKENQYIFAGIAYVFISFILIFQSSDAASAVAKADAIKDNPAKIKQMNAIEFAFRVIDEDKSIQIIDLRDVKAIKQFAFPASLNITFDNLFTKVGSKLLSSTDKDLVFIDNDGTEARKAAFAAIDFGVRKAYYLHGGMSAFNKEFANNPQPDTDGYKDYSKIGQYEFKQTAQSKITDLAKAYAEKNKPVETKKAKPAGGC